MTDQKRNKDIEEHHIRTMIELRDAERVIDKIYTLLHNHKAERQEKTKLKIDHAFLKDEQ